MLGHFPFILPQGGFIPSPTGGGGGGGNTPVASSIVIERIGNAPSVNLSLLGTSDWFACITTATQLRSSANLHYKAGGGQMFCTFGSSTGGQGTSTTLMNGTTRSSTAGDGAAIAALSSTGSWGVSTPNAYTPNSSTAFGVSFSAPSGNGLTRKLRVYWGNTLNISRLTAFLDDGTTQSVDLDNSGALQTHEHEITYSGGSCLGVTISPVSKYAGTHQLAFAAASLLVVAS